MGCWGERESYSGLEVQSSSKVMLATMSAQVVRSALRSEKGKEVVMFWYLESIEVPEKRHSLFGVPWHLRHLHSLGQYPQAFAALPSCT